jgi:hypothetical protein
MLLAVSGLPRDYSCAGVASLGAACLTHTCLEPEQEVLAPSITLYQHWPQQAPELPSTHIRSYTAPRNVRFRARSLRFDTCRYFQVKNDKTVHAVGPPSGVHYLPTRIPPGVSLTAQNLSSGPWSPDHYSFRPQQRVVMLPTLAGSWAAFVAISGSTVPVKVTTSRRP